MKHLLLTIALASSFAAPGFAGEAAHGNKSGDTHGEMKIGMPGDAAAVDRTVEIDMVETDDGEMLFKGGDLDFKEGETVRFVGTPAGSAPRASTRCSASLELVAASSRMGRPI